MRRADAGRASAAVLGTGGGAGAPARSGWRVAAGLLLGLAALLALPLQAQAATLVTNIGQSSNAVSSPLGTNWDHAQGFTTASHAAGYTLTTIEVKLVITGGLTSGTTPSATLHKTNAMNAAVATLTGPATTTGGNVTFTAPANTVLDADSTYFILLQGGTNVNVERTNSNAEGSGGRSNWTVLNSGHYRNADSTGSFLSVDEAKQIRVKGSNYTVPATAGVTVSETALTVTEEDTAGETYTVVLNTQPTSSVTVTVAGHASTDVSATPASLTFTTSNWSTAKTVTVTADNDTNTADETVSLTHSATSSDSDYGGITIAGVTVEVEDNDTAKVTGVGLTPGDEELVVEWTPVANATGYQVQWKSGGQGYNNSGRRAVISSGSTASHTISGLTNGTTYTVRMRATRTGANHGAYSDEAMDAPEAPGTPGVTVSETALTVTEEDSRPGTPTRWC